MFVVDYLLFFKTNNLLKKCY